MPPVPSSGWKRATVALLLFGVSFGYVEAAVVAYLRALGEPVRERFNPGRGPDDLFPLLKLEQLEAGGPELLQVLKTEFAREAATLVMLAAVATAVGRGGAQWLAAFLDAFRGLGNSLYAFLKGVVPLPQSLLAL